MILGRIVQIIDPVLDVAFPPGKMPNIYNALVVKGRDTVSQAIKVNCEVQQLLGNNRVRAVAMSATNGLMRGMEVIDTGAPLSVPVGGATLGRIFNVLGEPVDNLGPLDIRTTSPIHRSVPAFIQLDTKLSIFETGIKVVDLLAPYRRGGKIGLFGGAGVGKTILIMELINNIAKASCINYVNKYTNNTMDDYGFIPSSFPEPKERLVGQFLRVTTLTHYQCTIPMQLGSASHSSSVVQSPMNSTQRIDCNY
ncbi:uncharacterized protein LOC111391029 [Olea europaea var. sylvestris]|uniref:uncharacterized protein LOC111391029 n=1 Tax=Olea europaea var. sylvestris TaxID=158386 RepID=UPI000C1D85E7|nr:uncharacterized protein LOC111391029 [Olea europaea var. sylvestris]